MFYHYLKISLWVCLHYISISFNLAWIFFFCLLIIFFLVLGVSHVEQNMTFFCLCLSLCLFICLFVYLSVCLYCIRQRRWIMSSRFPSIAIKCCRFLKDECYLLSGDDTTVEVNKTVTNCCRLNRFVGKKNNTQINILWLHRRKTTYLYILTACEKICIRYVVGFWDVWK